MKNKKIICIGYKVIFGLIVFFLPLSSFSVIPVIDSTAIANLLKNYMELKRQYVILKEEYENAQQQLEALKELTEDEKGHYGLGSFINGVAELKQREWSPSNWQEALQGLSGGNTQRYQELIQTYQHDYPSLPLSIFEKGASKEKARVYQQDVQVNRAAIVNATYSFDTIKTHLQTIYQLSRKIDQTSNTKAAMDLNSRLIAEVAYIQTQELKMQILLNQQMAQKNADGIAEKIARAKFDRLPSS